MRKIPVITLSRGAALTKAPPDGDYAVITHGVHVIRPAAARLFGCNPFPWMVTIYRFKDGRCDEVCAGTDIVRCLSEHSVAAIYTVGLDKEPRRQLDRKLLGGDIELVE